jgi:hypothetical protein
MRRLLCSLVVFAIACASPEASGLAPTPGGTGAAVKFDVFHRPLPEIPLPNDFATRFDATSPTKRRLNASMLAPTTWEQKTRASLDAMDGWGTLAPITVSFAADLDVENLIKRHHGDRYDSKNDAILLVDVTPGSADYCKALPLDLGEGLYPTRLDRPEYYPDDPRGGLTSLMFEETEEDKNGNGALDPVKTPTWTGCSTTRTRAPASATRRSSPSTSARRRRSSRARCTRCAKRRPTRWC